MKKSEHPLVSVSVSAATPAGRAVGVSGSAMARAAGRALGTLGSAVTRTVGASGSAAGRAAHVATTPAGRALGIAVLAAIAVAGGIVAWRRFGPGTYVRYNTMFGRARVYQVEDDEGEPVRLLEVGGIVQSGTYLEERYTQLVFEYLKRYDVMFAQNRPMRRVCVLGCGGYDYPEHLIANHPNVVVDAVEIDPTITAIARRHFYLDRLIEEFETEETGRLNLICADALDFLEIGRFNLIRSDALDFLRGDIKKLTASAIGIACSSDKNATADTNNTPPDDVAARSYDAIVNDTYDAGTPPAHLTTPAFARAVHRRLQPGGLYLVNIVSAVEGPQSAFLWDQVDILQEEFTHVRIFPCDPDDLTSKDNVIVVASDAAIKG